MGVLKPWGFSNSVGHCSRNHIEPSQNTPNPSRLQILPEPSVPTACLYAETLSLEWHSPFLPELDVIFWSQFKSQVYSTKSERGQCCLTRVVLSVSVNYSSSCWGFYKKVGQQEVSLYYSLWLCACVPKLTVKRRPLAFFTVFFHMKNKLLRLHKRMKHVIICIC